MNYHMTKKFKQKRERIQKRNRQIYIQRYFKAHPNPFQQIIDLFKKVFQKFVKGIQNASRQLALTYGNIMKEAQG